MTEVQVATWSCYAPIRVLATSGNFFMRTRSRSEAFWNRRSFRGAGRWSRDMLSTALTTVAFDGAGNPYQVVYPTTPTYNTTTVPAGLSDAYGFELIPHRVFVGGFPAAVSFKLIFFLFLLGEHGLGAHSSS